LVAEGQAERHSTSPSFPGAGGAMDSTPPVASASPRRNLRPGLPSAGESSSGSMASAAWSWSRGKSSSQRVVLSARSTRSVSSGGSLTEPIRAGLPDRPGLPGGLVVAAGSAGTSWLPALLLVVPAGGEEAAGRLVADPGRPPCRPLGRDGAPD